MKSLNEIVAELRMGDDGGKPAYRIGRADKVEVSMPSGTPVRSYVIEYVTIKELADWIEAAAERERRQYERLHDCFWDKFAVQCIIRQMRDDRDDLKRAYPETAEKLEYFADALVKARCGRAPGNAAAMRKALNEIDRVVWDKKRHTKEETEAHRLATEALSAPARQCDVGTAWEQGERCMAQFDQWRRKGDGKKLITAIMEWAQTPYEGQDGGAE